MKESIGVRRFRSKPVKGFTLIELLVVVAIIAILSTIAISNYQTAQARAKTARAKAEMQVLTTALEAYYVDNNRYVMTIDFRSSPPTIVNPNSQRLIPLTTPIPYISRVIAPDPFGPMIQLFNTYDTYDYVDEYSFVMLRLSQNRDPRTEWCGHTWGRMYRISSHGPDGWNTYGRSYNSLFYPDSGYPSYYDPTNGVISNGDILRFGPPGVVHFENKIEAPITES